MKRKFSLFLAFLPLFFMISLLFPPKINAATIADITQVDVASFRFVDAQTIAVKINGTEVGLIKQPITGVYSNATFSCPGSVSLTPNNSGPLSISSASISPPAPNGSSNAQVRVPLQISGGICTMTTLDVVIAGANLQSSKMAWVDAGQIKAVVAFGGIVANETFTKIGNVFLRDSEKGQQCIDQAVVTGNNVNVFELKPGTGVPQSDKIGVASLPAGCEVLKINGVDVNTKAQAQEQIAKPQVLAAQTNASKPAGTGGGNTADEDSCDAKFSAPMTWIICPAIDMGIAMTDKVFSDFIKPLMEDVPVSSNPADGSYKAWQQFRLIGNIVLVGAMLAVVYAQVKG